MTETAISICSRALVTLGAEPISSFLASEGDRAVVCATIYPGLKAGIMAKQPWRFLMKKKALTMDSEAPIGEWKYSYIIPPDAIGLPNAVFSSASARVSEGDFEIFGQRVYCNYNQLFMDYTADVPESLWPAYFVNMMVSCLIAEIAFSITDQQNVADTWRMVAYGSPSDGGLGGDLGNAMNINAQGNATPGIVNDVFVNARFGGSI